MIKHFHKILFFLPGLILFFLWGCGHYEFGQLKRALPGGYDRVSVPVFTNATQEPGLEAFFTTDLRTEFERSKLAHVTSKNDAQVILEGTILTASFVPGNPINSQSQELTVPANRAVLVSPPVPLGATPAPSAPALNPLPAGAVFGTQYTAVVTVKITARKVSDNTVLWQGNFSSSRVYQAALIGDPRGGLNSMDPIYNQSAKVQTVSAMAKDMMSEAHDRITENF